MNNRNRTSWAFNSGAYSGISRQAKSVAWLIMAVVSRRSLFTANTAYSADFQHTANRYAHLYPNHDADAKCHTYTDRYYPADHHSFADIYPIANVHRLEYIHPVQATNDQPYTKLYPAAANDHPHPTSAVAHTDPI